MQNRQSRVRSRFLHPDPSLTLVLRRFEIFLLSQLIKLLRLRCFHKASLFINIARFFQKQEPKSYLAKWSIYFSGQHELLKKFTVFDESWRA